LTSKADEKKVKRVYLDVAGRMHSLYKELMLHPPRGYQFVALDSGWDRVSSVASKVNLFYSFQEKVLGEIIPVNFAKACLEKFKKPPKGTDLTYAAGHLVFRKEPWVVDLEFVTQLVGYNVNHFRRLKKIIGKVLTSEYCKKVICWTEACKRTVLLNLDCRGFVGKLEVVRLAVHRKNFVKDYDNGGKIKLLFVGSANILGEFEYKGGREVLEAFLLLHEKYHNLELVIRSDIPQELRSMCKGLNDVTLIDGIIPWTQLEQEFKSADIFLFPSHSTPGLAILDAMSYELPVITTDVWANPEMVDNGETGFIIKKSEKIQYYIENFIPNWNYDPASKFIIAIKNTDPKVVEELVEKTSILIDDEKLRRKMGKAGRQEIETGKFSLEKRNERLRKIFDKATET